MKEFILIFRHENVTGKVSPEDETANELNLSFKKS